MTSGGRVADAGVLHVDALALLGLERVARVELREAVGLDELPVGAARQRPSRSSCGPRTVPPKICTIRRRPCGTSPISSRLADLRAQLERERTNGRRRNGGVWLCAIAVCSAENPTKTAMNNEDVRLRRTVRFIARC